MEALSAYSLPPGFGFHPTDIELISHYLKRKILGMKIDFDVIPEIDIYKNEPWDLPAKCHVPTRDSKWHFFAPRDKKYPNGARSNRTTVAGYWKSTGKDRNIRYQNRVIGTKKTLVFHEGRPPSGKRTEWIMHEYYINENECKVAPDMKDAFVLCRVTKRNGWGIDSENVAPQSENVQSESVDDCSAHSSNLASAVVPEKSSCPSESAEEDFEAWFSELFDPNFPAIPNLGDVKNEPEEAVSSLVLNTEPSSSYYLSEVSEDSHLLFPVEEFCDILQSDPQSYEVFGDLKFANFDTFTAQQEILFSGMNNEESIPNDDDNTASSGVQIRRREAKPHSSTLNQRIRLQASKMESRNKESLSGTIRVNEDVHLDPYDDKLLVVAPRASKIAAPKSRNANRGPSFFARCSSASINCFFVFACMLGTAALLFCFLLREAPSFILEL